MNCSKIKWVFFMCHTNGDLLLGSCEPLQSTEVTLQMWNANRAEDTMAVCTGCMKKSLAFCSFH